MASPINGSAWETIAPLLSSRASPLRTAHLRDPVGPQIHFASESFIDELATATQSDAVEFRLRHLTDARDIAAVKAAEERAGWEARPSGPRADKTADMLAGRGIAYAPTRRHPRRDRRRGRDRGQDRSRPASSLLHRRARLRVDRQSGPGARHHRGQSDPWRQPRAVGGGHLRCRQRHQRRLGVLSDPRYRRDAGRGRDCADRSSRIAPQRRRRSLDAAGGRGDRQCHLRRHGRAPAPRALHAGTSSIGAGLKFIGPTTKRVTDMKRIAGIGAILAIVFTAHLAAADTPNTMSHGEYVGARAGRLRRPVIPGARRRRLLRRTQDGHAARRHLCH